MRDPERIDKFIDLLREIWHKHPDMRFSQLIGNALGFGDNYYVEDDESYNKLDGFYNHVDEVTKKYNSKN